MRYLRFADADGVLIELPIPERLAGAMPLGAWMINETWYMRYVMPGGQEAYSIMPDGSEGWRFTGYDA